MTQKKQDLRPRRIYARLTVDEYAASALSLSEYVRRRVFGRRITSKVDLRVLAELRRLGGLMKHVHNETGGIYSEDTRDAIQALTACARGIERKLSEGQGH